MFTCPLWLMNFHWLSAPSPFPYTLEFWTKSECSHWLKYGFQQPPIGHFTQTNCAHMFLHQELQLPNLSRYPPAVSKRSGFPCSLTSFLPPFPVQSVPANLVLSLSKTLCAAYVSVYQITLTKYKSPYKFM